jgi:hypothetical protein
LAEPLIARLLQPVLLGDAHEVPHGVLDVVGGHVLVADELFGALVVLAGVVQRDAAPPVFVGRPGAQLDLAVEVGDGLGELADHEVGAAAAVERLDVLGVEFEALREVLDGVGIPAFAIALGAALEVVAGVLRLVGEGERSKDEQGGQGQDAGHEGTPREEETQEEEGVSDGLKRIRAAVRRPALKGRGYTHLKPGEPGCDEAITLRGG